MRYSCSLTFENNYYIFGGDEPGSETNPNQISKVNGLKLDRIGTLDLGLTKIHFSLTKFSVEI